MSRFRSTFAVVVLVLGVVLVPLSATAWWLRTTVTDTDAYVATVAPLATDAAVVTVVENQLTTLVVQAVQQQNLLGRAADALVAQGVPRLAAQTLTLLSDPLSSRLDQLVGRTVSRLVESPAFAVVWEQANRVAHTQLIRALDGDPDLSPVIVGLEQRLTAAGVPLAGQLPPATVTIPIARTSDLKPLHTAYVVLGPAAVVLPMATVLLLVGGMSLLRHRRRAAGRVGLGVLGACGLLLLELAILRSSLTGSLAPSGQQAAVVVFDAVADGLRGLVWLLVLVVSAALVIGLFTGSAESAVSSRRAATACYRRIRSVLADSFVTRPIAVIVAAACLLALLFTSGLGVGWTSLLVVVAVAAGAVAWVAGPRQETS